MVFKQLYRVLVQWIIFLFDRNLIGEHFQSLMPLTRSAEAASLPAMFENYSKYDKESKDAKRLNRGLADFICLDQVPVYRVKKMGFQKLVQQLDRKYDTPGKKKIECIMKSQRCALRPGEDPQGSTFGITVSHWLQALSHVQNTCKPTRPSWVYYPIYWSGKRTGLAKPTKGKLCSTWQTW